MTWIHSEYWLASSARPIKCIAEVFDLFLSESLGIRLDKVKTKVKLACWVSALDSSDFSPGRKTVTWIWGLFFKELHLDRTIISRPKLKIILPTIITA